MQKDLEPYRQSVVNFRSEHLREVLGQGLRRRGYVHPNQNNIVIKQAIINNGRFANLREWWLWHALDKSVRPLFNPCWRLWDRGLFIAQPRLQPLNDITSGYVERIIEDITDSKLQRKMRKLHLWGYDSQMQIPRIFDYEHIDLEDFETWVPSRIQF